MPLGNIFIVGARLALPIGEGAASGAPYTDQPIRRQRDHLSLHDMDV
jgi:hypothetical protein